MKKQQDKSNEGGKFRKILKAIRIIIGVAFFIVGLAMLGFLCYIVYGVITGIQSCTINNRIF